MGIVLSVDIGNTNIVLGIWNDGILTGCERFVTKRDYSFNELEEIITCKVRAILPSEKTPDSSFCKFDGSILSSVVPQLNDDVLRILEMITNEKPLLMGAFLRTGIDVSGYDKRADGGAGNDPFRIKQGEARLGTDRIVDLSAAHAMYPDRPVMVCDLGSCTTTSVIDANGRFIGGMISAGLQMSLDAQAQRTSQLPQLEAGEAESLLGRDTASNMMSGVVAGTGLMITELYRRLGLSLQDLKLVLTGGLGRLVLPWIEADVSYEPDLLMKGLYEIYRRNQDA